MMTRDERGKKKFLWEKVVDALEKEKLTEIETSLHFILEFLSGPFSPQKYAGIDFPVVENLTLSEEEYKKLFFMLCSTFLKDGCVLRNKNLSSIFRYILENGYFESNLKILCQCLKGHISKSEKLRVTEFLLILLQSSKLTEFFLRYSSHSSIEGKDRVSLSKFERNRIDWDETITLITSLPEKVANEVGPSFPDELRSECYCRKIGLYIIDSLLCISTGLQSEIGGTVEPLGIFLGRLCYVRDNFTVMSVLVRWLDTFSFSYPIFRRVCNKMFIHIPEVNKERVLWALIKHVENGKSLYYILGDVGLTDLKYKYLITRKVFEGRSAPLEDKKISVLIDYFSFSDESHNELRGSFLFLLKIWSDSSHMTHSSLEYHLFISKCILAFLSNFSDKDCNSVRNDTLHRLLGGVTNHLESPNADMKVIGMVTAEEISKTVNFDGPKLIFDLEPNELSTQIRDFARRRVIQSPPQTNFNFILESFIHEICDLEPKGEKPPLTSDSNDLSKGRDLYTLSMASTPGTKDVYGNLSDKADTLLDSDDDEFRPYDMQNDTLQSKLKPPSYLQELIEYLTDGDVNKIEAGLIHSQDLVRKESRQMDEGLAEELTKIVLHIDNQCNFEDFEDKKIGTLAALVVNQPKICGKYLSSQFYEQNFTTRQRLDVLMAIKRASLELSAHVKDGSSKGYSESKHSLKAVVGFIFFPLIQTFYSRRPYLDLFGSDRFLLCELLNTLGFLVNRTGPCEIAPRMVKSVLELTWHLRVHEDSAVRRACLGAIYRSIEFVPNETLTEIVPGEIAELMQWLSIIVEKDCERECRVLAAAVAMHFAEGQREKLESLLE